MDALAAVTEEGDKSTRWLLIVAASMSVCMLAATLLGPYGYFIDEFYYLACARRPALGYVDHPPLAPWILTGIRAVAGESLLAIRLVPAIAAGATAYASGLLAREWGGNRFAMCLAAIGTASMPALGVIGGYYSMNCFELLVWAWVLLLVARIANDGSARLWLWVGALIGGGFLLKHTIVLLALGVTAGIVLTPLRRHLRTRWPWLGVAIAALLMVPNLGWQIANGWPSLEFYREATAHKNIPTSPLGVLVNQSMILHPLLVPIWGVGAVSLVTSKRFARHRFMAIVWWGLLALAMAAGTSRPDRIVGLGAALFASGAVMWEAWVRRTAGRVALIAAAVAAGLAFAPLSLPILSFEATARYAAWTHAVPRIEKGKSSPLPQWLADRTGWESMIDQVGAVVNALPAEERASALVFAPDYGTAGALELWGPRRGFPRVISTQNSYYHWSEGHTDSAVLIAIGVSEASLRRAFSDVRRAGTVSCSYCMSWRADRPVFVARQPIVPLSQFWPEMKHYE
ncbi:MAG: glycosyltransferase family 39 protein [Deltaproteobacteria bacterium]|nr:glycosyltransferase family 39 protein [Deltaproteobacteria bacterium]